MNIIERYKTRQRIRLLSRYYRTDSFEERATIALALDRMDADGDDEDWVTMNGTHVMIGEGGEIKSGPPNLAGRKYPDAKSQKSKKKSGALSTTKKKAAPLVASNFPSAFTKTKTRAATTKKLIDYINNLEGADPDVIDLYNSMGLMENVEKNGFGFEIKTGNKCSLATRLTYKYGNPYLVSTKLTIPKLDGDNITDKVNTTLHEMMHLIDLYARNDTTKGDLSSKTRASLTSAVKAASNSMSDKVKSMFEDYNKEYNKLWKDIGDEYEQIMCALNYAFLTNTFDGDYDAYSKAYNKLKREKKAKQEEGVANLMGGGYGNLQDIYDALYGGKLLQSHQVTFGHGTTYYAHTEKRNSEILANYAALSVTRPDLVEVLREDKPELVAELDATVKDMLKKAKGE